MTARALRLAVVLTLGALALAGCQRAPAPAPGGATADALASFEALHERADARVAEAMQWLIRAGVLQAPEAAASPEHPERGD